MRSQGEMSGGSKLTESAERARDSTHKPGAYYQSTRKALTSTLPAGAAWKLIKGRLQGSAPLLTRMLQCLQSPMQIVVVLLEIISKLHVIGRQGTVVAVHGVTEILQSSHLRLKHLQMVPTNAQTCMTFIFSMKSEQQNPGITIKLTSKIPCWDQIPLRLERV